MKLQCRKSPNLPRLAWCGQVQSGNPVIGVEHGPDVEIREDRFFEAVWSGPAHAGGFMDAPTLCGTGGAVDAECVRFTGSSDRISPIFSIRKGGVLHVSNSPFFALTSAGEEPDELYPFYFYDFVRYWRMGLHCMGGALKLASRHRMQVHFNTILSVDNCGHQGFTRHRTVEEPGDFASYRSILRREIESVFQNALAPERRQPLLPLTAISRGYDSNACAALAALAGCREAFSFTDSHLPNPALDSGRDNARILGMECREYDRWSYLEMPGLVDAEFALFGVSASTPMAVLQNVLRGRLLVAGYLGDLAWDPRGAGLCDLLTMPWSRFLTGVGQLEFRLRVGYQVMAPAAIGARHNRALHRISLSDEMKPWQVNGSYNRPLARRIAEEAGLPRGAFGVEKHAGGHTTYASGKGFSAEGLHSYQQFIQSRDDRAKPFRLLFWKRRLAWRHFLWRHFSHKSKQYKKYSPWRRLFPFLGNTHPRIVSWDYVFTFQWAHYVLRRRYVTSGPAA